MLAVDDRTDLPKKELNKEYDFELSPLHTAIRENDAAWAQSLLSKGADPNLKEGRFEYTPLHTACMRDNLKIVQILVEHGAQLDLKNRFRDTPLHLAITMSAPSLVRYLVGKLLKEQPTINDPDKSGNTPLHTALLHDKLDALQILVEGGADLNIPNSFGNTPLHTALFHDKLEALQILVEGGADLNTPDSFGNTPLHTALLHDKLEALQILVEGRADLNTPDSCGNTPLHTALLHDKLEALQILVEGGADLNTPDSFGNTPLHTALLHDKLEALQILVEGGADLNTQDSFGNTPLRKACRQGHLKAVQILVEGGSDLHLKEGVLEYTPLHTACMCGNLKIVQILVEHGAQCDLKDGLGRTPLQKARLIGHTEIERYLIQQGAKEHSEPCFTPLLSRMETSPVQDQHQNEMTQELSEPVIPEEKEIEEHIPQGEAIVPPSNHLDHNEKNRGNRTLKEWFHWSSGDHDHMSLLDRTGLGWLIKKAFSSVVDFANNTNLMQKHRKKEQLTHTEILFSVVLAPLYCVVVLPSVAWKGVDTCVAALATPFLWLGGGLKNLMLDQVQSLPDQASSSDAVDGVQQNPAACFEHQTSHDSPQSTPFDTPETDTPSVKAKP